MEGRKLLLFAGLVMFAVSMAMLKFMSGAATDFIAGMLTGLSVVAIVKSLLMARGNGRKA